MDNFARQVAGKKAPATLLAILFCFASLIPANAASGQSDKLSSVEIDNFGKMDERLYRGAQPDEEEYKNLAALGVKMIIDLRDDPKDYARPAAEAAGMKYINIPMSDKDMPRDEQINQFLEIAKSPDNGPFYIHCKGGRHRTGVMGAVYRFNHDGWTYDQAYKEMKDFDYYSRWGHGKLKKYVQNYYQRMKEDSINASTVEASTPPNQ